jgi:hypothetical protein
MGLARYAGRPFLLKLCFLAFSFSCFHVFMFSRKHENMETLNYAVPSKKQMHCLGNEGVNAPIGIKRKLFQLAMLGGVNPRIDSLAPYPARAPLCLWRCDQLGSEGRFSESSYWQNGRLSGCGFHIRREVRALRHVVTFSCFLNFVKT